MTVKVTAKILDGKAIAQARKLDLKKAVESRSRPPGLAVLLVGEDPASEVYVRYKRKDCASVGFKSDFRYLSANTSEADLLSQIDMLNKDESIDGIIVQLPLPAQIDSARIIESISPEKDVDGFHPYNMGRLAVRQPTFRSCTPKGVMDLIQHTGVEIRGLHAVIVGASNHVGRPMGLELLMRGCTVTTTHKFTKDTAHHVRQGDIVISAVGIANLIKGAWIKRGSIVIDVGITRGDDGKLHGDVEFEAAAERAAWITPVPGGVGPMTRITLLESTFQAAEARDQKKR